MGVLSYQHTESPVFSQAVLAAAGKVHFEKNHQATLSGVVIQAEDLVNDTVNGMEINAALGTQTCTFRMKQKGPLSGVKMLINQGQEVLAPSVLNVNKIYTEGSALKLVSVEWDQQQTEIMGLYETAIKVPHTWHEKKCKKTGVPPEALAVAAVAFTVMTGGGGVGLLGTLQGVISGTATMAQLGGAVLTTVYHTVGASLISNGGNVEMTLKQTLSKDGLKSLAISLAAEGILDHCGVVAPTGYASFGKICEYAAKKTVVETGVKTAFRQQKFKKILKEAGINFIVSVAGRYCAQEIGKAYGGIDADGTKSPDGPSLGFGGHKLCHAALGAALGWAKGDALAGALGGLVSELVADSFQENKDVIEARVSEKALEQNIIPGTEDYKNLIMAEAKPLMNWSKIAAAAATALARHDINISVEAATNALEHNFKQLVKKETMAQVSQSLAALAAAYGQAMQDTFGTPTPGLDYLIESWLLVEGFKESLGTAGGQGQGSNAAANSGMGFMSAGSPDPDDDNDHNYDKGKEKDATKAEKKEDHEGFSKETKDLLGDTDKYKRELLERPGKAKDQTTLNAARKELNGEQLDVAKERRKVYDHVKKVRQAQDGLDRHISAIKNRLGFPKLSQNERVSLEKELSKASKLLDKTENYVPRK